MSLYDELKRCKAMIRAGENENIMKSPINMLKWIVKDNLVSVFPNICVELTILPSIPVTNCESKRSFSTLYMIKNKDCCLIGESRQISLSILSIECDLKSTISFEEVNIYCGNIKMTNISLIFFNPNSY